MSDILDSLFTFPIVMVDGQNEQKKEKRFEDLAIDSDTELDIVIGEAECPFYDFIGITDRWVPRTESWEKALNGEFDACFVVFANMGSFVVPWTKKKFKAEIKKFQENLPDTKVKQIHLSDDQVKQIFSIIKEEEEGNGQ